ncbi:Trafficking protein particle complex subunit 3 [Chionoecetes opilio]|uniref:Trafficking protein particle complex subunit 3 n=1 Tax=Chionoecetes opilio TaxID=41210 RepID=A0A8J5CGZ1_CHIOP|nr:Trafficking protein particle complex subunit 3 [Chionoecetes opilio]
MSGELFTLTYGSLVAQLLKDYENVDDVNRQLERMGYNIGMRLIEDFLARANPGRCYDLRDTADKIQQAFKLYLGVSPSIGSWNPGGDEFSIVLETNPMAEFVELPDHCLGLRYSNILAGIIRGACEMVQMEVMVWFIADQLKGDNVTEIRIKFVKRLEDAIPAVAEEAEVQSAVKPPSSTRASPCWSGFRTEDRDSQRPHCSAHRVE